MPNCKSTAEFKDGERVLFTVMCSLEWPHAGDHELTVTWPVDPDDRILAELDRELNG